MLASDSSFVVVGGLCDGGGGEAVRRCFRRADALYRSK